MLVFLGSYLLALLLPSCHHLSERVTAVSVSTKLALTKISNTWCSSTLPLHTFPISPLLLSNEPRGLYSLISDLQRNPYPLIQLQILFHQLLFTSIHSWGAATTSPSSPSPSRGCWRREPYEGRGYTCEGLWVERR